MKVVLFWPEWQVIRLTCLAPYNSYGGMTMRAGAEDSIKKLFNYIAASKPPGVMDITLEEEKALRNYRVHNLLVAATNGFMQKSIIDKSVVQFIMSKADEIKPNLEQNLVMHVADRWDWDAFTKAMTDVYNKQFHWYAAMLKDFEYRKKYNDKVGEDFDIVLKIMYDIRDRRNEYDNVRN